MPLTSDYVFEALLGHNYFPMVREKRDDLPPLFSTETLTPEIGDRLIAQQIAAVTPASDRAKSGYDQIVYNATKFNNTKRHLHIPCPGPYARLCGCLRDNWPHINWTAASTQSQIKPENHDDGRVITIGEYDVHTSGRVIVMEKDAFPADATRHLEMSFGAKYLVDADVASCFPSIYTHSIPWALVGHALAKTRRGRTEWFNEIDALQRHLKRGETHGIPIGPGTSHIINEIILGKVDQALAGNGYQFVRYIDDYKCYCSSRDQCDSFLKDLEHELSKFLLLLNEKKVKISDLPLEIRTEWVGEIAGRIPSGAQLNSRDVMVGMDAAIVLQRRFESGSVLKYAARTIASRLSDDGLGIFVTYLLQLAPDAPVIVPVLAELIRTRPAATAHVDKLNAILKRHLTFRRSDAICWTLYVYGLLGKAVPPALADQIIADRDCMAIASLLAIGQHRAKVEAFVRSLSLATSYDVDQYWILLHESQGAITDSWFVAYCENSGLKLLRDEEVSFLREPTRVTAPPGADPS